MKIKNPWLELTRAGMAPTALADVLAGYVLVGIKAGAANSWSWDTRALAAAMGSSVLCYTAGMALGDAMDARRDAALHPGRPVPSGRVSAGGAAAFGSALLLGGVACGFIAGRHTANVALLLAGAILAYVVILKRGALSGAVGMGACRMANMMLGMTAAGSAVIPWDAGADAFSRYQGTVAALGMPLLLFWYAACLTLISTTEESRSPQVLYTGTKGLVLAVAVPALVGAWASWPGALAFHGPVALVLLYSVREVVRRPRGPARGLLVRNLILCIPLYDAGMVAGKGDLRAALAVACLAPIALGLSRAMNLVS